MIPSIKNTTLKACLTEHPWMLAVFINLVFLFLLYNIQFSSGAGQAATFDADIVDLEFLASEPNPESTPPPPGSTNPLQSTNLHELVASPSSKLVGGKLNETVESATNQESIDRKIERIAKTVNPTRLSVVSRQSVSPAILENVSDQSLGRVLYGSNTTESGKSDNGNTITTSDKGDGGKQGYPSDTLLGMAGATREQKIGIILDRSGSMKRYKEFVRRELRKYSGVAVLTKENALFDHDLITKTTKLIDYYKKNSIIFISDIDDNHNKEKQNVQLLSSLLIKNHVQFSILKPGRITPSRWDDTEAIISLCENTGGRFVLFDN